MAEMKNRNVMLGIGELADELGVNRQSIWAVMKGTRTSHRLHDELRARGFCPAPLPGKKRRATKSLPRVSAQAITDAVAILKGREDA